MKVTGPGTGASGVPNEIGETQAPAQGAETTGVGGPEGGGQAFAERLSQPRGAAQTAAAQSATTVAGAPGTVATHDIAADLRGGRVPLSAAMETLIDRVVAQQVGAKAPEAVRESLRATLRDAVETDPLLAGKLRSLGDPES
jgi:hypothetical protein